jgi:hypothetical protein
MAEREGKEIVSCRLIQGLFYTQGAFSTECAYIVAFKLRWFRNETLEVTDRLCHNVL